ncbi:SDR family NAD(P)-dependent oxidoreductase [Sphingosinicella microcystinivorans]|uniref:SDR family NAD(P)-dependent oxidoreductase n=1 Tax=Sphingosinicella microcystinivorans TaxID=335406 RepID=UPI0022F3E882|nr:SDR family NAD(P)-dependent oxidoreductase [Sphingosinicella microcystinivorans]WBX82517.1 SDR family NAD(P)-dependent oxidoreductase [Sphingosinicella microcystinivorans]
MNGDTGKGRARLEKDLAGKVAFVTGAGKARGMGAVTAATLAARGATVVLSDLCRARPELHWGALTIGDSQEELERLAAEIRQAGGEAHAMAVDVTDRAQVEEALASCARRFGSLDILFNNAGTVAGAGPFLEVSDADWGLSFAVNVQGMINTCRAAIPVMLARGGGAIVNNSSLLGITAVAGYSAYTTTKHAVIGLTKTIAAEFGSGGICCNAICPGMIQTQMGVTEAEMMAREHGVSVAEAEQMMSAPAALRRCGTPEEVADVVAFLAGPGARFLTGLAVPVAGGFPMGL